MELTAQAIHGTVIYDPLTEGNSSGPMDALGCTTSAMVWHTDPR